MKHLNRIINFRNPLKPLLVLCGVMCCFYSCDIPDAGRRSYDFNTPVAIGQIWIKVDSLDPFMPIKYDTIKIIDMKGKYSKVVWNGDTTSMETDIVTWRRSILK